jgi:Mrp family chromosome partitioning ATPase
LHRLFEADVDPGLCEVLRGEADLAGAIRETELDRLSLLPGGRWNPASTQALARGGVKGVLDQVSGQYDFVLVDSSPVLPVVDAVLLGQHVDAVIFSVLRDVSRLPSVYAAYERVNTFGIRTLGAVISGAREGVYGPTYQAHVLAAN